MVRISFFTCVFLIGLRLVIGWHFFFEGLYKVNSNYVGPTETSKPFTSAGYFAEAEGPLGPKVREQIGDADSDAIAKLTLTNSGDDNPKKKMPARLATEWDEYGQQFAAYYKLDETQKKEIEKVLDQAKNDYVLWLTDEMPKKSADDKEKKKDDEPKKIKKTVISSTGPVTYEVEDLVQQRVFTYKAKVAEIRDVYEKRLPSFGKDVEKLHLRTLKSDAAGMRSELMKDVDEQTKKMKDALSRLVGDQLAGLDLSVPEDPGIDQRVLALLTLKGEGNEASVARTPAALDSQWNNYLTFVREHGRDELRRDPQRAEEMLNDAKLGFVRYLLDLDQYLGTPVAENNVAARVTEYRKLYESIRAELEKAEKEPPSKESKAKIASLLAVTAPYRQPFVEDLKRHTEILKQNLGGFQTDASKGFDSFKGTITPEKEKTRFLWRDWPVTKLEWLDWSTRWVLLIAGGCILIGLFTRLACLSCAIFLIVEFLSNPPFPWLPVSPKAEGNYTFVNKNIVELMALMVLTTLPTGRWLGLDALLSRIWPFRGRSRS